MSKQTKPEPPTAPIKLRLLDLPGASAPLVARHGLPSVEIEQQMTVFRWEVSRSFESPSERSGSGPGLILARVRSEKDLDDCVRDIWALEQALQEIGRSVELIVASCDGSHLNEFCRPDIEWAQTRVTRRRLSWIAVNDFEASSGSLEQLASVFEQHPNGVVVDPKGDEQILALREGEIVATNTASRWDESPSWEPLLP